MKGDIEILKGFVLRNQVNIAIASREYKVFPKKTLRRLGHYGYIEFQQVTFGKNTGDITISYSEYGSKLIRVTSLGLKKLMEEFPVFYSYFDNLDRRMMSERAIDALKEMGTYD